MAARQRIACLQQVPRRRLHGPGQAHRRYPVDSTNRSPNERAPDHDPAASSMPHVVRGIESLPPAAPRSEVEQLMTSIDAYAATLWYWRPWTTWWPTGERQDPEPAARGHAVQPTRRGEAGSGVARPGRRHR